MLGGSSSIVINLIQVMKKSVYQKRFLLGGAGAALFGGAFCFLLQNTDPKENVEVGEIETVSKGRQSIDGQFDVRPDIVHSVDCGCDIHNGRTRSMVSTNASIEISENVFDGLFSSVAKQEIDFLLPSDERAFGEVESVVMEGDLAVAVQGTLALPKEGRFYFRRQESTENAGPMVGLVWFNEGGLGYRVEGGSLDELKLVEVPSDQLMCRDLKVAEDVLVSGQELVANGPGNHPVDAELPGYQEGIPSLQSLPGATAVIYIDFDGQEGTVEAWWFRDVAPSSYSAATMRDIWEIVAEDFAPFNINVTTDSKVYENAQENSRMRCLVTNSLSGSGSGFVGSFNWAGDVPCWAPAYASASSAAGVISHEVGHTMGLYHDGQIGGEAYFAGTVSPNVSWSPLMGYVFDRNLTTWSNGEYYNADNTQDDLHILANENNNTGFRPDDHGDDLSSARYLSVDQSNNAFENGVIETRDDFDVFKITTTSNGDISLNISPAQTQANLDIQAELLDSQGAVLLTSNPELEAYATISATGLGAGDYYLRVTGVGRGTPMIDAVGYTDYGSLGFYTISGQVANSKQPSRYAVNENAANGMAVGTVIGDNTHSPSGVSYSLEAGSNSGPFSINPSTGEITVSDATSLNYEQISTSYDLAPVVRFSVNIDDSLNPSLNEVVRVEVSIVDLNEPITIVGPDSRNLFKSANVGTTVASFSTEGEDLYRKMTWSIISGNASGAFTIGDGGVLTLSDPAAFEAYQGNDTIQVQAINGQGAGAAQSATHQITVVPVLWNQSKTLTYEELSKAGATASQSTTYASGYEASLAIDGNYDPSSITHTQVGDFNSWWEMDLGSEKEIGGVELFNRDLQQDRLSNFRLSILDTARNEVAGQDFYVGSGAVGDSEFWKLAASSAGRYVRVQLLGNNNQGNGILTLSEVKLFKPNVSLTSLAGSVATQSTTTGVATADRAVDGDKNRDANSSTFSQTDATSDNWWQVDLDGLHRIDQIVIHNLIGPGVEKRLSNFRISLWSGASEVYGSDFLTEVGEFTPNLFVLNEMDNLVADRVLIESLGANTYGDRTLSFAEVEVFGESQNSGGTAPVLNDVTLNSVLENGLAGALVGTLTASDADSGDSLDYSIVSASVEGAFVIDPATGEVTTFSPLDYEEISSHEIIVRVTDSAGLKGYATVTIPVGDEPGDDSDSDGLPDEWEAQYFGSTTVSDGSGDADGDGLIDSAEYTAGLNPSNADTDGDGYSDSFEMSVATNPNDSQDTPSYNAAAWWSFDETTVDGNRVTDVISGTTGNLVGGAVLSAGGTGRSGQPGDRALDLGTSSESRYLSCLNALVLQQAAQDDKISVSFWQKLQQTGQNQSSFWAVSPSSSGESRGLQAHTPWSNGTIYFDMGSSGGFSRVSVAQPSGIDWTQWQHIALVKNGSVAEIWVNGVLQTSGSGMSLIVNDFTQLVIGAQSNGGNPSSGLIDDFAIYRTALTSNEITDLAAGNDPVSGVDPTAPVGAWAFNEGSGSTTADSSGNAYDGTISGAIWTPGRIDDALQFDADQVDVGAIPLGSSITLAAWIKPDVITGDRAIFGRNSSFTFKTSGSGLRFTTPGIADHDAPGAGLQSGLWQHVAVTFDAGVAGGARFYVNGQPVGSTSASSMNSNANPLLIGANQWIGQEFAGAIDEVIVYDVILSDSEVNDLYLSYPTNEGPVASSGFAIVAENSSLGTQVTTVVAADPDASDTLSYEITDGNAGGDFTIDSVTGVITTSADLDYEATAQYTLTVNVTDDGSPALSDTATITIDVSNVNEAPTVANGSGSIAESATVGTLVTSVNAFDVDAGDSLTYEIISGNDGSFAIGATSGAITTSSSLNFESTSTYDLVVQVTDSGGLTASSTVAVTVTNVNESPSIADAATDISEDTSIGAMLVSASASDPDGGDSLTFALTGGNDGSFSINPESGVISLASTVDFETQDTYLLTVSVTDAGGLSDSAFVSINITDVNESPNLSGSSVSVPEDSEIGSSVATITANDPDANDTLTYAITSGNDGSFAIDLATGEVTVAIPLNYESTSSYSLQIQAMDSEGLEDTATLSISVLDVPEVAKASWSFEEGAGNIANDGSGNGFDAALSGTTWESGRVGGGLGLVVSSVDAGDVPLGNRITLAAWIKPDALLLNHAIISKQDSFSFKTHGDGLRLTTPSVNDHDVANVGLQAGVWQHVAVTFDAGSVGGARFFLNGQLVGNVTASQMAVNSNSLLIGSSQWIGQEFAGDMDEVVVYDDLLSDAQIAALYASYPAANSAPVFTNDSFTALGATAGESYLTSVASTATDPDQGDTLTFSLQSSSTWLSISPDGTLSGTPSAADIGTQVHVIRVTDAAGAFDEANFSLSVSADLPSVSSIGAEAITQSSATLNYNISETGGEDPSITLYYGTSDGGTNPTSWEFTQALGTSGAGSFQTALNGLNSGTVYYFAITASNSAGTVWGGSVSFTTSSDNSPKLVRTTISGVSNTTWTSVGLGQSYNSAVIIATPIYASSNVPPMVTRIRNVSGSGFEVKIDRADGLAGAVTCDVSIVVVEEGVYTLANEGVKMEAVKFTSTITGSRAAWVGEGRTYQNSYNSPVVLGQVMSANDVGWSTFWCYGSSRTSPPSSTALNLGKMVAEDLNTQRLDETVGYIVIESGSGSIDGINYTAGVGTDTVRGVENSSVGYDYSLTGLSDASAAAVSLAGLDGADGAWAVLFGSNPISSSRLTIAVDEDQIANTERKHTTEQCGYLVFE